jgi:glycosyltransferase involved in cell wall biosynthesis
MSTQPLISIVAPFYNEGEAVDAFHRRVVEVLSAIPGLRFELVCVNDGSRDDTIDRLRSLVEADARVRVIDLSRNFGKEAALSAGLDAARGDAVIPIDADLQDPPELIPQMIERWREGYEVVLARRADRSTDTWAKRGTAALFYRLHGAIGEIRIPDNVGDFRLMDRRVVDALRELPERCRFMKGMFAWVGFRTVTIDYVRAPRTEGQTKFSGWRLWNLALEGITGFSTVPLRVWTYMGLAVALVAFLYAVFIIARTLVLGIDIPGYASLLVVVLFLGGIQMIGIGVIGEYIGRIYLEAKQRPVYVVRERIERD